MPPVDLVSWQLFFSFPLGPRRALGRPHKAPPPVIIPLTWQIPGQQALFPARPDYLRFKRALHANPDNPTLIEAKEAARRLAEGRGWAPWVLRKINDTLPVVLSGHAAGDTIAYSDLVVLDQLNLKVGHTAEVLDLLGILDDDRVSAFDAWLERKLTQLNPTVSAEIELWATTLRDGGPRTLQRDPSTIRNYLGAALPALVDWSGRYQHLREVTREDIKEATKTLTGLQRNRVLVALRSIFQFHKAAGRVFRNPTAHFKGGLVEPSLPPRLEPDQLDALVAHATTPLRRLILALTAVHAARPTALQTLGLSDVDLDKRRLTVGGHPRRLDELTEQIINAYLRYRHQRWPHTVNQHLIVSERTAQSQIPVSPTWLGSQFREVGVPLNQIRQDRQLEEALTRGPDALHLAVVFGISERAAMRYANAARAFLESPLEQ
ncbi:hypothetical protein ACIQZO_19120 [Streptomyces sp. NPDC097617]|uniref:hypothetical protein n=1 Tax=Streptomyces sp. NPDC097617 TaxID=3366091 RepID=UPI00381EFBE0